MRVQLGGAAGDVHDAGVGLAEGSEAKLDRLAAHHLGGAIRTRVDMAVLAGHVAELADVDLEDLDPGGAQAGGKVFERQALQRVQLLARRGERRMPR